MAILFSVGSPGFSAIILPILYISWRLWRFTLSPLINKNHPRELPYLIPLLGHTVGFFQEQNKVLEKARKYFNDSKEPYSLTVGGKCIYIVTAARDVAAVYKDSSSISWDLMVRDIHRLLGVSEQGMNILFTPSLSEKWSTDLKTRSKFLDIMMLTQHNQLLDADKVNTLLHKAILPFINQCLEFPSSKSSFTPMTTVMSRDTSNSNNLTVSLLSTCTETVLEAMIQAYFGTKIWQIYPEIVTDFLVWEQLNWKILFQLPTFLSQDVIKTKTSFISGLERYFNLSKSDKEDSSYYIKTIEAMAEETGMNSKDLAAVIMLQLWAILGNVSKVSFWLTAHLVHSDTLRERVQAEVQPALGRSQDNPAIDYDYLCDQCPLLGSMFHETLRHVVSAAMARDIFKTSVVGGKVLQKGHKVLLPLKELHIDRSTWGPDPDLFQASRFQDDPKLLKSLSLRPFGGGVTLCPGRFFAKKLVLAVTGSLLLKYDISLNNPGARFPRPDNSKPSPGAVGVMEGDDVILNLKRR